MFFMQGSSCSRSSRGCFLFLPAGKEKQLRGSSQTAIDRAESRALHLIPMNIINAIIFLVLFFWQPDISQIRHKNREVVPFRICLNGTFP